MVVERVLFDEGSFCSARFQSHTKYAYFQHPIPYQILIRSTNLPTSWEKNIIIRKHLAKFGDVTAVNFIGYDRVLVSFRLKSVAQALVGQKIVIEDKEVLLEEVSSKTIF